VKKMKKFRQKSDIAEEVNKIDAQIKHLKDKKKEIESNINFLNDLREIYFEEYIK